MKTQAPKSGNGPVILLSGAGLVLIAILAGAIWAWQSDVRQQQDQNEAIDDIYQSIGEIGNP